MRRASLNLEAKKLLRIVRPVPRRVGLDVAQVKRSGTQIDVTDTYPKTRGVNVDIRLVAVCYHADRPPIALDVTNSSIYRSTMQCKSLYEGIELYAVPQSQILNCQRV
jgi:hypothetical protein